MSIPISIRVPAGELSAIRERVQQRITGARSLLIQSSISAALTDIIESTPVQTGEARAGWQGELNRVGNSPAATPSEHLSLQSATNTVDHIVYLEYGTSRMQPRSSVRPALARLESSVRSMFRWGN
jgi:hypothetical protein